MKITITGTSCHITCMYAETSVADCHCSCQGVTHGLAVEKKVVKCTPSARVQCMTGNEDGSCKCACEGKNHGVYQTIENFDDVKINYYA